MINKWICSTVSFLGAVLLCLDARGGSAKSEFFERRIRPVLADNCYECHSASAQKAKGGLRVDARSELVKGGKTGPAIVPGRPEASLLITAIAHGDPDLQMPHKKPKLSNAVIADFEQWIREGAEWSDSVDSPSPTKQRTFDLEERKQKQLWLWTAPTQQKVPLVTDRNWPITPEDYFILQRLERTGPRPARQADDRTWLRRVHFAITGLPPTRERIEAFLGDPKPGARERVVDQLLASPHFGERWARHWMDLMRYAESRGHEGDYYIANAWQYRDYLIRAFNADVPYNQFVLEHVAGDLLPHPRLRPGTEINESVLATGWAFLGEENHSPVDIRGDECERIDNKIDVFSKTFLGLTISCARCHDHKFDPIRAQDYYALSGFMLSSSYRQVRFEAMENNRAMADELSRVRAELMPRVSEAIAEQRAPKLGRIAELLIRAARELTNSSSANCADLELQHWIGQLREATTNQGHIFNFLAQNAVGKQNERDAATPSALPDGAWLIADYTNGESQSWKADGEAFGRAPARPGDIIAGTDPDNPIARLMTYGAARRDLFWNRLKTANNNENDSGRLAATSRSGQMIRTPTVTLKSGKLHYLIRGKARVYAAVDSHLMLEGPLHGQLTKVFSVDPSKGPAWVTHDLSEYQGHRVHIEFGPDGNGELEILRVVEAAEQPNWYPKTLPNLPKHDSTIESYARAFQTAASTACVQLARGHVDPEQAVMANWLVQNPKLFDCASNAEIRSRGKAFLDAEQAIAQRVQWESHTAVAWFDGTGVDEHILLRGKPFKPGAVAPRRLPEVLAQSRITTCPNSSGRYELGLEMISPTNPLLARVIVNRVWHHLFGRGIVASVDNLGALGDRPSHPELLDHLAWSFANEDQWSLKRLIKRLVLSRTFGMESVPDEPMAEEKDPSNLLLHRMPVRRLEGEVIRDALLAVSGRLNGQVGGPPEPIFLTEFLVGRGRPDKSGPLDGDGRRSVYMALRRNFLATFMQTFDAPTPFNTVGRRNVTNVPAQSLALMNDPLVHQQAEVWAQRLWRETANAPAETKIKWLFESAYGRLPEAGEIAACLESVKEIGRLLPEQGSSTQTWAELCHALFNSNEFIYVP